MWEYITENYNALMNDYSDKRVKDWFLMSSPLPTLSICLTYAFIVKIAGPRLMRDRKPFQLKKTLIVYNFLQVLFSTYLFYEAWDAAWGNGYSLRCEPVDYSTSPNAMRIARGCWWYYFSKFTEFFDTFFFVMRKKYDQVSTLHVIHHGVMPMSVWFGVKFTPGGHSTFFGLLNTFVHIIMYSYYLLAALGPHMQKYLWWKKYLTVLQMVQFTMVFVHGMQLLFTDCNYPKAVAWFILMHAVMFFFLFYNFYQKSYKKNEYKQKVANQKKNDDDRSVTTHSETEQQRNKAFWSNLATTPCFLPAVTDGDSVDESLMVNPYSLPSSNDAIPNAFVTGGSSLHNRVYVEYKQKEANQKKNDDDRSMTTKSEIEPQLNKSFWSIMESNLASAPSFIPAVTDDESLKEYERKVAQQKKNDDDRAYNRPMTIQSEAEQQRTKSFWSKITSTTCFLPAINVGDSVGESSRGCNPYSIPNAFVAGESSLHNMAYVQKLSNAQ